MINLQAIKERIAAATPGPWYTVDPPWRPSDRELGYHPTYVVAGNPDPHIGKAVLDSIAIDEWSDTSGDRYWDHVGESDRNLNFAAHARTDLPACVEEIERLREVAKAVIQDADDEGVDCYCGSGPDRCAPCLARAVLGESDV